MASEMQLPPGFRFHPTDDELVTHYLCRKCASQPIAVPIIKEIDLYKYDPWDLPGLALYGEKEWYFFSPRDRKYPNGSRPNRAAGRGYWKATGADKPIGHPKAVGIKKALVFYAGKAPKGEKTNWIMHEYRLADVDRSARKKSNNLRLDDWVLCRIYNKKGNTNSNTNTEKQNQNAVGGGENLKLVEVEALEQKPVIGAFPAYLDTSDSVPRLHTDSSCSEHVHTPEFACEREVQSEPSKLAAEWERAGAGAGAGAALDFPYKYLYNYVDASMDMDSSFTSPLQDMFMYNIQKPF